MYHEKSSKWKSDTIIEWFCAFWNFNCASVSIFSTFQINFSSDVNSWSIWLVSLFEILYVFSFSHSLQSADSITNQMTFSIQKHWLWLWWVQALLGESKQKRWKPQSVRSNFTRNAIETVINYSYISIKHLHSFSSQIFLQIFSPLHFAWTMHKSHAILHFFHDVQCALVSIDCAFYFGPTEK